MGLLVRKTFYDVGGTKPIPRRARPDNVINKTDVENLSKQWFPSGDPTDFCKYILDSFDSEGNNSTDFKELYCASFLTLPGNSDDKLNCSSPRYHR